MFYKFNDCIILETVDSDYDCREYRVLNLKTILNKKANEVLYDERVTLFETEKENLSLKQIKDKNPKLTDKAINHILDLFTDKVLFSEEVSDSE